MIHIIKENIPFNKMKKIAIIFEGDYRNPRGAFNATINRIKHLVDLNEFDIQVFMIIFDESFIFRKLRNTKKIECGDSIVYDGLKIRVLKAPYSLIDYILQSRIHLRPSICRYFMKSYVKFFEKFDLVSAHSTETGLLAYHINKLYGVPYAVTWHGSDVHSEPRNNKKIFEDVKNVMENSECNFFVSQNLQEISSYITDRDNKYVLYNGVDKKKFYPYIPSVKIDLKKKYGLDVYSKHIAFIGGFIDIKRVLCLPVVFKRIKDSYKGRLEFCFVGGGKYESRLKEMCEEFGLNTVFLINIPADEMPCIYNCMDLIVLPSQNEGLPLTAVEALACGTSLVGSRVGGIAEVVGVDNTTPLDDNFTNSFSEICLKHLYENLAPELPEQFDWDKTALKEAKIYKMILK